MLFVLTEVCIVAILWIASPLYLLKTLFLRRRRFRSLFPNWLIVSSLIGAAYSIAVASVLPASEGPASSVGNLGSLGVVIWIQYFQTSPRIAATFVN